MERMRSKPAVARKRRRAGKRVAALVLLLCMGAAIYLAVSAGTELLERKEGEDFYGALASAMNPGDGQHAADRAMSKIDFAALREQSPDVVGWISLEGSDLNYPIVQGTDNEFYLRYLPDGTANEMGSIMMDAACSPTFQSDVTILHGHHMRSGAMFGNLGAYGDEAYFLAHPTMRLYTPQGDFDVVIIAAYTVDGSAYGYPTAFSNAEAFDEFVRKAIRASAFDAKPEVTYGDRLVLLSTCAYAYENARFVVIGKIVE